MEKLDKILTPLKNITLSANGIEGKIEKSASKLLKQYLDSRKMNQRVLVLESDLKKEKMRAFKVSG